MSTKHHDTSSASSILAALRILEWENWPVAELTSSRTPADRLARADCSRNAGLCRNRGTRCHPTSGGDDTSSIDATAAAAESYANSADWARST